MSFVQNRYSQQSPATLRRTYRLTLGLIGMGVLFASVGLGEAVYRLVFLDFEGATDRFPIEMLFGVAFAWVATTVARRIYQYRIETSARINLIRDRNCKIRDAAEALAPWSDPCSQQAIRVIREEVNRIEWTLADITPH